MTAPRNQRSPASVPDPSEPPEPSIPPHLLLLNPQPPPEESRLVSRLMYLGRALADRVEPQTPSEAHGRFAALPARTTDQEDDPAGDGREMLPVLAQIETHLDQHPRLTSLLGPLAEGLADGACLDALLRCCYPAPRIKRRHGPDGKHILTRRQVEVLREASCDLSHEEIAAHLGVSKEAVDKHFKNVYRALGVRRPLQAVARAVSLGYLELDAIGFVSRAGRVHVRDHGLLECFLSGRASPARAGKVPALERLERFASLMLVICAGARAELNDRHPVSATLGVHPGGIVCATDHQGQRTATFGHEHLWWPTAVAVAPHAAARHGFAPEHLFVAHRMPLPQALNDAAIVEFTPEGGFVRSFTGGLSVDSRLTDVNSLAFHPDGRLLATSGALTDSVLAFSKGGAAVTRFAGICTLQVCASRDGLIYAAQHSSVGGAIKVYDSEGNLERTFGPASVGMLYGGIAVGMDGRVYVTRCATHTASVSVEVFGADGRLLSSMQIPHISTNLAFDQQGRLHVPCRAAGLVHVYSADGEAIGRWDLRRDLQPVGLAFGPAGRCWVVGPIPGHGHVRRET